MRATACSTSAGVHPKGSVCTLSRLTIISETCFPLNSRAPPITPASSSTVPSAVDWATIDCSSPRVKVEATSSLISTRIQRKSMFDIPLRNATMGAKTCETRTNVGTIHRAIPRAARVTAAFFGTISPKITCRYVTTIRVTTKARISTVVCGKPRCSKGDPSRWCRAGSETFRISREQIVIPNWQVANIRETRSSA